MNNVDLHFKNDVLFFSQSNKKDNQYEYLYVHIDEEKEIASFVAYFDSLNSNSPKVYQLRELTNATLSIDLNPSILNPCADIKSQQTWQRAIMKEEIIPGTWKQLFKMIREALVNNKKINLSKLW